MRRVRKDILTTGEVANICNISINTVIKCFDKGLLKGFKIPGSSHRRVLPRDLINFLEENKIPYDEAVLREFQTSMKNP